MRTCSTAGTRDGAFSCILWVLVVFDVHVELIVGDLDAVLIELGLDRLKRVKVYSPIIGALCPSSCNDINGACVVCADTDGSSLLLHGKLVRSEYLVDDRLCLLKVVGIADREGEVDSAKLVFGKRFLHYFRQHY